MIATNKELLFFLSSTRNWYADLEMTKDDAYNIVRSARKGFGDEDTINSILIALGAKCIREKIVIPSVWLYNGIEKTAKEHARTIIFSKDWNIKLGYGKWAKKDFRKHFDELSETTFTNLLTKAGAVCVAQQMILPSIWEWNNFFAEPVLPIPEEIYKRIIYSKGEI